MAGGGALLLVVSMLLAAGEPQPNSGQDVICTVNGAPIEVQDLEAYLFTDDCDGAAKNALDILIKEHVIRQELARKGVSVAPAAVDQFLAETDGQLRASRKTSLADFLAAQGLDPGFFRRSAETTIGLYRLAGGRGSAFQEMTGNEDLKARVDKLLAELVAAAKTETDPGKLPPGLAATVNGDRITIPEAGRLGRLGLSAQARQKWLGELQTITLVKQEMRRRKLELAADDVEYFYKVLSAARSGPLGERDLSLDQVLQAMGQNPRALQRQQKFCAVAMLVKMVRGEVNDDEVRRRYNANPAEFGDGVPRASMILLKTVTDDGRPISAEGEKKVRVRIDALRQQLVNGGDFAELARKSSDHRESAERGGDLGYLSPKMLDNPVVRTAFGLKVGELSVPVQSAAGWHLVKVTDLKKAPLDAARPAVLKTALEEHRARLLQQLRDKARIEPGPASP